jgi:hypothetical protein
MRAPAIIDVEVDVPQTLTKSPPTVKKYTDRQRRHERFPCGANTFGLIQATCDTPLELAGVRNISQSGAGLLFHRRLEAGRVVLLNLFNARRNFATRMTFRVIYCEEHKDGLFLLGGAFSQELSPEEVNWLR